MRRIANILGSLATGFLLTAAGLAIELNKLVTIGLALLGAAAVFWLLDWMTRKDRRVFLPESITPDVLTDLVRGLTAVQAKQMTKLYVGKWMKVSGRLYDVTTQEIFWTHVDLTTSPTGSPMVLLYFFMNRKKLHVLQTGHIIHAQGKIDGFGAAPGSLGGGYVRLRKSEILGVEPPPAPASAAPS